MDVNKNFRPGIDHPFYFIRTGLYEGIRDRAGRLHGTLLDFGCGEKPYKSLFSKVDRYIGLDFENPGHSHKNENIDVFYNGENIPFDDNYFDSALCSEVFEHLFNLEVSLSELCRVLKPGGTLLVTCPFVWEEHELPHDYARYTTFALNHLFERHGFEVLEYEKKGNFIQTIAQLKILNFNRTIGPRINRVRGGHYVTRLWIAAINVWASLKGKIMGNDKSIYLSNIFLVQKKKGQ
jgi:SAM-dependent methyltransferase